MADELPAPLLADQTPEELVAAIRLAIDESERAAHKWGAIPGLAHIRMGALRSVEADRRVLERHRPERVEFEGVTLVACLYCSNVEFEWDGFIWAAVEARAFGDEEAIAHFPDADFVDLAARYGISVEEAPGG